MEPNEYEIMYRAEDSHWWFKGMDAITRTVLGTYYPRGGNIRILDAGCGTGAGMAMLSEYGAITGFDISPHAIRLSRQRSQEKLVTASVMEIPFASETFDLVTSFDVLYFDQIQDESALQEFFRVLVPGGRIILRVPAFNWLRGVHDLKVSTGHRYTLQELSRKLKNNKLDPDFLSYANTILFPVAVLKRMIERWLPVQTESDLTIDMKCFDKLFEDLLILESRIITKFSLPFGLSIIGVGQKSFGEK